MILSVWIVVVVSEDLAKTFVDKLEILEVEISLPELIVFTRNDGVLWPAVFSVVR